MLGHEPGRAWVPSGLPWRVREAWVPSCARPVACRPGPRLPLLTASVGVHREPAGGVQSGQHPTTLGFPGTAYVLALKVLHLGKSLSPKSWTLPTLAQEGPRIPLRHTAKPLLPGKPRA